MDNLKLVLKPEKGTVLRKFKTLKYQMNLKASVKIDAWCSVTCENQIT